MYLHMDKIYTKQQATKKEDNKETIIILLLRIGYQSVTDVQGDHKGYFYSICCSSKELCRTLIKPGS